MQGHCCWICVRPGFDRNRDLVKVFWSGLSLLFNPLAFPSALDVGSWKSAVCYFSGHEIEEVTAQGFFSLCVCRGRMGSRLELHFLSVTFPCPARPKTQPRGLRIAHTHMWEHRDQQGGPFTSLFARDFTFYGDRGHFVLNNSVGATPTADVHANTYFCEKNCSEKCVFPRNSCHKQRL